MMMNIEGRSETEVVTLQIEGDTEN